MTKLEQALKKIGEAKTLIESHDNQSGDSGLRKKCEELHSENSDLRTRMTILNTKLAEAYAVGRAAQVRIAELTNQTDPPASSASGE